MMIFWLVLLAAILWLFWTMARRGGSGPGMNPRADPAETLLRERYARGEIDDATFRRLLDELRR